MVWTLSFAVLGDIRDGWRCVSGFERKYPTLTMYLFVCVTPCYWRSGKTKEIYCRGRVRKVDHGRNGR
jgi:hypothetical protein